MRSAWVIPVLICVVLMVMGARAHPLWGDEAETALFGRNILAYGVPRGWDGVNIMGINNAVVLDTRLINHTSPWAQYYLTALAFQVFGQSSFIARIPPMVFGALAVLLVYALALRLTGSVRIAVLSALLLSVCVPFLLFAYQARYYSLVTAMALVMAYTGLRLERGSGKDMVAFVAAGVVFFYGNYVIFAAYSIALAITLVGMRLMQSDRGHTLLLVRRLCISAMVIATMTLPWMLINKPLVHQGEIVAPAIGEAVRYFFAFLFLAFRPYMDNASFPVTLWVLWGSLLIFVARRRRSDAAFLFPVMVTVLFLACMAAGTVVADVVTSFVHSRYTMLVLPFFALTAAVVIDTVWQWKKSVGVVLTVLYGFTSLLALQPRVLLAEYIREMTRPYETPDRVVARYLDEHAREGDTAFVSLDRDHEPLIFHLGQKIRFVNRVSLINTRIFPENRSIIPRYIYDFRDLPDWVILYSKRGNDGSFLTFDYRPLPPGIDLDESYEETVLPVFFADMSRPEMELRSFVEVRPTYQDQVFIYRKK